ncbi:MAG TPA: hypothetical protein VGJ86_03990 [Acidimicrobiales bacterium]|jgi:DNA-3-methyladenine glycosylase II
MLDQESFRDQALVLAEQDASLAAIVQDYGLPSFWHRPPTFATLALLIVEQQVSLASAKAVFDRLTLALGQVTPATLLRAEQDVLVGVGLTRQKMRYLRLLAAASAEGTFDQVALLDQTDDLARRALLALTGVGPWTADAYLLSALRRPDIWPVGDRALQVGVGETLEMPEPPTALELEVIGERWRPSRSVVARLIWHAYLSRRGRTEPDVIGLD